MRTRSMWLSLGLSAAAVVAATCGTAQAQVQQGQGQYSYRFYKQAVPIKLDLSRVAVWDSGAARAGGTASVAQKLGAFDVHEADVTAHTFQGLYYAQTPGWSRNDKSVRDYVAAIAKSGAVEFASPVFLDEYGPMQLKPEVVIGFEEGVSAQRAEEIIRTELGGEIVERNFAGMRNVYYVRTAERDGFSVLDRANRATDLPEVRFADPDMVKTCKQHFTPNDTSFGNLWGIRNTAQFVGSVANEDMDGDTAWDITTGNAAVIVAVIDDGVQLDHPDLNLNTIHIDVSGAGGGGGPVNVCDEHGTTCAGCVSAKINNSLGVVGIAPACRVASVKFSQANVGSPCPGTGSFSTAGFANGLNWAQGTAGAKVTSCSNGFGFNSTIAAAYLNTRNLGLTHFASTGNSGAGTIGYPGSDASVNGVGSVNFAGVHSSFSQTGTGTDFSAPGEAIYTTDRTGAVGFFAGDYGFVDGTSYSCPYAAGVAALCYSLNGALTPTQVETFMQQGCRDKGTAGYDTTYGWGFLNARNTAFLISPPPPPTAFNLVSPAPGATGVSTAPLLDWSDSSNITGYTVTLDNDSNFSSPIFSLNVNVSPSQLQVTPGTLVQSTTYFWKVVAIGSNLTNLPSTPASAQFTTQTPPPPPCFGDINNDHVRNTADLTTLLAFFGTNVPPFTNGDLDGNGLVNTVDLTSLLGVFGVPCPT